MRAFLQRFGEREALLALGCIVSGLVFSILSPYFATPDNLLTIARNSTELLLIGLGMTLLLGIGGIDVSVGSVLGLAAIGIGRLLQAGITPALAALACPVAVRALRGGPRARRRQRLRRDFWPHSRDRGDARPSRRLSRRDFSGARRFMALGPSRGPDQSVGCTLFRLARFRARHRARLRRRLCRRSVHAVRRAPSRHRQFGSEGAACGHRGAQDPGRGFRRQRRPVRARCELLCRDLSQCGDDDRRHPCPRSSGRGCARRDRRDRRAHQPARHGLRGHSLASSSERAAPRRGAVAVATRGDRPSAVARAGRGGPVWEAAARTASSVSARRGAASRPPMTPRVSPILAILGLMWVVVVAGLAVLKPGALALSTVTAVLQFSTILALVSLGQALVIVCGGPGIYISVGGMVSLAVVLAMLLVKAGLPGALLPVLCLALGLALGLVNGFLVTRLRVLPLIATLGTFYVYSGTAVALTGGAAQAGVPDFLLPWGRGAVGGRAPPIGRAHG